MPAGAEEIEEAREEGVEIITMASPVEILGENGHLSNHTAGRLLAEVMTGKMKYVFLGHLSEENNNPHLAYETVEEILRNNRIEVGTHVKMDMASRFQNGVKVEL